MVIVGWSLGGLFGRELARSFPDRVRALITLGTPFSGDPRQNNVWPLYEKVAKHPVDNPPLPGSPTSRRSPTWPSGRAATA